MIENETLLSLGQYAKIMGINPAHFFGTTSNTAFPVSYRCSDVWPEYSWQNNDVVSRAAVAREIESAEYEVKNILGYWPAPKWVPAEKREYARYFRPSAVGIGNSNVAGFPRTVTLSSGKFIAPGQRAVVLVGTATVAGGELVYSDDDGDNVDETATITLTISAAAQAIINASWYSFDPAQWILGYTGGTDLTDAIRDPVSCAISGATLTLVYRRWQLIDRDLYEAYPQANEEFSAISLDIDGNFLTSVSVYLEYPDYATRSAEIVWNPTHLCSFCDGSGCTACQYAVQDGCAIATNNVTGIVFATPATYDSAAESWTAASLSQARAPDSLRVWYLAGDMSDPFVSGRTLSPMKWAIAQAIAFMVTARLERPLCGCGNVRALSEELRTDLTLQSSAGNFVIASDEVLKNPFGTKIGEVRAWQRIRRLTEAVVEAAVI